MTVRLRVVVSTPGAADGVYPPRDETIVPWMEPCPRRLTIKELEGRIKNHFADIYPSKGQVIFHHVPVAMWIESSANS